MKEESAFERGAKYMAFLSSTLAVCISAISLHNDFDDPCITLIAVIFLLCAISITVCTAIGMRREDRVMKRKADEQANFLLKNNSSADMSVQNNVTAEDSDVNTKETKVVEAMSGIRITPTLQSVESDSGYWQEDLVDDAMFVGTAKLVFSVKNCSDKDLLSVTFDKHDNKLDEDGERIPKESSSELCTTLAFWDKNQAKTDVTLSDGKVITCQKRLYWQLGIYVCSCKVEFDVLIKREKDPSEYNRWTLSPCHDGKCKTSEYKFREATQAQSNGK